MITKFKAFDIEFAGLKNGFHDYEFDITDIFFKHFDTTVEFWDTNLKILIKLQKKETMLELFFTVKGFVTVSCDISNEAFEMPLETTHEIIIKFGHEYLDDGDDVVIIPQQAHKINVAQWIYEFILLSIPLKKIKPSVFTDSKYASIIQLLDKMQPHETSGHLDIDPRWEKLKKLK